MEKERKKTKKPRKKTKIPTLKELKLVRKKSGKQITKTM